MKLERSSNSDKLEELERIKAVVRNNMWGWGEKIAEKIGKLKVLREEIRKA